MRHIFKRCSRCIGTGLEQVIVEGEPQGEVDCTRCDGEGQVSVMGLHEDLVNVVDGVSNNNGVFDSYLVLEALDPTEHGGLTDTQKDGVLHILACGRVDLNDGKAGKTRLWNWFGAESTTVANLITLIG